MGRSCTWKSLLCCLVIAEIIACTTETVIITETTGKEKFVPKTQNTSIVEKFDKVTGGELLLNPFLIEDYAVDNVATGWTTKGKGLVKFDNKLQQISDVKELTLSQQVWLPEHNKSVTCKSELVLTLHNVSTIHTDLLPIVYIKVTNNDKKLKLEHFINKPHIQNGKKTYYYMFNINKEIDQLTFIVGFIGVKKAEINKFSLKCGDLTFSPKELIPTLQPTGVFKSGDR